MSFFELTLHISEPEANLLENHLLFLGALSVTLTDAKDNPIYEPKPRETPLWSQIKMTGLFDDRSVFEQAGQQLRKNFPLAEIRATQLDDQVWERLWMDYFKPIKFGQGTWVIPDGYAVIDDQAVNLMLDPGLAFGTGTHPTTALCLEWLDSHDVKGLNLVDFGCGSGILAVSALLHGADTVYCVDIDDQAITATQMNAEKNKVDQGIQIVPSAEVNVLEQLDGVVANILAEPLVELKDEFFRMLKPGGFVVLSGILKEQAIMIKDKYHESFVDIEIKIDQDWALLSALKG